MAIIQIYWDSNCFLGIFNNEIDKVKKCKGTITKAESGDLIIVTSAITLVEVIRLKGRPRLKKDAERKIVDFFKHQYIVVHNLDRMAAEKARELMWKHPDLLPKDSVHVATAILRKIPKMHTFDQELLKLDNKYGDPKLCICEPDIEHQGELF